MLRAAVSCLMHSSVEVRSIACPEEHTYERKIMATIDGAEQYLLLGALVIERLCDAICESDSGRPVSVEEPRSSSVWLGCGKLLDWQTAAPTGSTTESGQLRWCPIGACLGKGARVTVERNDPRRVQPGNARRSD